MLISRATLIVQAAPTDINALHLITRSSFSLCSSQEAQQAVKQHKNAYPATPFLKALSLYPSRSTQTREQIASTASLNTVPKAILAKGFRSANVRSETSGYGKVSETKKESNKCTAPQGDARQGIHRRVWVRDEAGVAI